MDVLQMSVFMMEIHTTRVSPGRLVVIRRVTAKMLPSASGRASRCKY